MPRKTALFAVVGSVDSYRRGDVVELEVGEDGLPVSRLMRARTRPHAGKIVVGESAEAARIIADAKAQAAGIVAEAEAQAAAILEGANKAGKK
ncbi:hypothetical protein D3C80_956800 [compost metagenome]